MITDCGDELLWEGGGGRDLSSVYHQDRGALPPSDSQQGRERRLDNLAGGAREGDGGATVRTGIFRAFRQKTSEQSLEFSIPIYS